MLADSAYIQEKDAEYLARKGKEAEPPLYTIRDATRALELMIGHPYDRPFDVVPGVRCTYVEAGHILGSASVVVDVTEDGATKRLVFSGDIGRSGLAIIRDPKPPTAAHAIIIESTYGNRDHESVAGAREHLARVVRETAARGGRIIIPSFAVGRTQELVYDLHELVRDGKIPLIPIYIDSPLAVSATSVFATHPEVFDQTESLVQKVEDLFEHELVHYTRDVQESKRLNTMTGPIIIISASGMAESGRIVHHLKNGAPDPRNTVLIVGFQAEHTLGRRIVEKRPFIRIHGDEIPLRAQVEVLNGYSAHADRNELARWLDAVKGTSPSLGPVFLVHGEPEAQDVFAEAQRARGYDVRVPVPGDRAQV